jgi:hypothetical protein
MTNDEIGEMLSELLQLYAEQKCEVIALKELLTDRGFLIPNAFAELVDQVKQREYERLKDEAQRRAFDRILARRPKQ